MSHPLLVRRGKMILFKRMLIVLAIASFVFVLLDASLEEAQPQKTPRPIVTVIHDEVVIRDLPE